MSNLNVVLSKLSTEEVETLKVFMWDSYKIDLEVFKEFMQHYESEGFIEFIKELSE